MNVLIVEDEADGQQVLGGLLKRSGVMFEAVKTAEEAINLLAENAYSAVVIDLMLPGGMDGIQLLRTIRSNPAMKALPCFAITAYHSSGVKKEVFDTGFNGYFPKPLDGKDFMSELKKAISQN